MTLARVAVFAAGYIVGAKAGRERYAQIVNVVERASKQLEEFSSRHPPARHGGTSGRVATAARDRRRRPSDGVVVEASILARLLGLRLLTLDATVVLVPAEVTAPPTRAP